MTTILKYCLLSCLVLVMGLFAACSSAPEPDILIKGSTTMAPLLERLANEYSRHHSTPVLIEAVGSINGAASLIRKECDLASSSSSLSLDLLTDAEKKGVHLKAFPICRDRIIPVVHTANPADRITLADLQAIFSGKTTDWQSINGQNADIHLIFRKEGSGTHQTWKEMILEKAPLPGFSNLAGSNSAVLAAVAEDRTAIGYISEAFLNPEVKKLTIIRDNKEIHIERPLFLYADTNRMSKGLKSFLTFLYSGPAKDIITDFGFSLAGDTAHPLTDL